MAFRRVLMMTIVLIAMSAPTAWAGPNAGGTIFAHDAGLVYTSDTADYCGLGQAPGSCEGADVNLEGSSYEVPRVFKVYAAFRPGSAPRLKGMTFGIHYDPVQIFLVGWGPCIGDPNNGAAEFPGAGWPESDTGTSLVFQFVQAGYLTEAYWFAGYNYYGLPNLFVLRDNPDPVLGGNFADDSVPAAQDPIAGFGTLGFDTDGETACPQGTLDGACCVGEECTITSEDQCPGQWEGPGTLCDPNPCSPFPPLGACCVGETCEMTQESDCHGDWRGPDVPCEPNPCEAISIWQTSWGRIKSDPAW